MYSIQENKMTSINNKNYIISLLEHFIKAKIMDCLSPFSLYDLFTKQEYIVKYTSHIIYNDLQKYLVNIVRQNTVHANSNTHENINNIIEQICFVLLPIISFQIDKYINELRQMTFETNSLKKAS